MAIINKPLTNMQLELLQLYSLDLSEAELMEIRRLLARYFAEKASDEMDKQWQKNAWSNDTMDGWLKNESE